MKMTPLEDVLTQGDGVEANIFSGGANGATDDREGRTNGAAHGSAWLEDGRWSALRRRGQAAGWLVEPSQVTAGLGAAWTPRWPPAFAFGPARDGHHRTLPASTSRCRVRLSLEA